MPFGDFKDFEDCVSKNQDKDNPEGFCAFLHKKITGKYPSEMEATGDIMNDKEELMKEIISLTEEIDRKENELNEKIDIDKSKDEDIDKADLLIEINKLEDILNESKE